jgi:DNA-binding NarL/FixJ family response regulator
MNPQHFFLSGSRQPSERWKQAFPEGQTVAPADLTQRLKNPQPKQCLCWVASDEPEWRTTLELAQKAQPGCRVVVLSGAPEPNEGLMALDAGALGYTHSHALPELLQEVATVVQHGGLWAGPELLKRLVSSTSAALATLPQPASAPGPTAQNYAKAWATLSGREAQVALQVAAGKSNKEVADQLFISERTIKAHLGSIFDKLGVRDRLQLALLVGTLSPSDRALKGVNA